MVSPPKDDNDNKQVPPSSKGRRRNFAAEIPVIKYRYPIGCKVYHMILGGTLCYGPLEVVEHCKPAFPQATPQYIVEKFPAGTDRSKWVQLAEFELAILDDNYLRIPE